MDVTEVNGVGTDVESAVQNWYAYDRRFSAGLVGTGRLPAPDEDCHREERSDVAISWCFPVSSPPACGGRRALDETVANIKVSLRAQRSGARQSGAAPFTRSPCRYAPRDDTRGWPRLFLRRSESYVVIWQSGASTGRDCRVAVAPRNDSGASLSLLVMTAGRRCRSWR
jgi:hypothetical protein